MAYWIAVVASRVGYDRLHSRADTWWCVSKEAKSGDLLAIYVARARLKNLPEDKCGITACFEVIGPAPERENDCRQFGGGQTRDYRRRSRLELRSAIQPRYS